MIAAIAGSLRVVLYEGDGSQVLPDRQRFELMQMLLDLGYSVSSVRGGVQFAKLGDARIVVLGRLNEEGPAFCDDADDQAALRFVDINGLDNEQVVSRLKAACAEIGVSEPGGWKPWFPVIDYSRCANCMQCLGFCLFDVYGVTADGQIAVQRQANCKTDCPACARVCPEAAIIFPKYMAGPINGDEIREEDVRREAMKVDVSSMLGGDLYSALRDRSAKATSRFSKERDDDRALQERQRCMKTLQQDMNSLGIPDGVMASLPILDQLQVRAEEAKRRAQAALEQHRSAER
ncbi:MAG: ferredoxin family protein [Rhodopirellula sp.]|nr:ferredoxin family protein [Rhodopirellula sp.]